MTAIGLGFRLACLIAALAICGFACSNHDKSMKSGFPSTFGLGNAPPEENFRGTMQAYRVPPEHIECMVARAQASSSWPPNHRSPATVPGHQPSKIALAPRRTFTPKLMNAIAYECGVDPTHLHNFGD